MNALALRLDRAGFNPRLLMIFLAFAGIVGFFVIWELFPDAGQGLRPPDVDLKKLGQFDFDPVRGTLADIPPDNRKLDGKQISLEGFMYTPNINGPMTDFQFVYNLYSSHGMPPKVQERVFVTAPPQMKLEFSSEEIRLIGTLHVRIDRDQSGMAVRVFEMDLARVEPL